MFFEVLNKPVDSRTEKYKKEPYSLIPYLNGGLFDPDHIDQYDYDLNTESSINEHIVVPDSWIRKFFDVLEVYNFTIDEDTSDDMELSIDPEMLGRIFENLLARINPETEKSVRNSTGSFYTPREVVDYMVNKSFEEYICTETSIENDKISFIISANYPMKKKIYTKDEKIKILDSLGKLKIIDPACGSGAFTIGILQKIVQILDQIDPECNYWLEKQTRHLPN